MSRIGTQPVTIKENVKIEVKDGEAVVSGPLGELRRRIPDTVTVKITDSEVIVERKKENKQARSDHGTTRALIANMVEGVTEGFKKELELVGMGYRAEIQGTTLVMALGWNHPVKVEPPEGITFTAPDQSSIEVSGMDKEKVGLWAAKIRGIRKPEPYKGKGIRYKDEVVRRKTSKSVKEDE
jgi:large subunit ribosomal protein L6